jgi:hypothetical protein
MQAELRHAQELKDAQAAAETKMDELLKEFTDASAVLRAELEEETRARKEAQDRIATLTTDQAEYDRLVMQADALAFSKPFFFSLSHHVLIPVTFFFFFLPTSAFPGLPGLCAQEGSGAQGCTSLQQSGCALGRLRPPCGAVRPYLSHESCGPAPG